MDQDAHAVAPQSPLKRSADMAFADGTPPAASIAQLFEGCKEELDTHHERRERIIKASRDITAASKKIIFALQRLKSLGQPVPDHIQKQNQQHYTAISKAYASVAGDLQGLNAHRYGRAITGGTQELIEAISFEHYLATQTLISPNAVHDKITALVGSSTELIPVTEADYVLGIYDMSGELMRFAVTTMATTGAVPSSFKRSAASSGTASTQTQAHARNVLDDLRELRAQLQSLGGGAGASWAHDASKKMEVLQTCVDKVENALYGLVVRGAERPKGWVPEDRGRAGELEIESVGA